MSTILKGPQPSAICPVLASVPLKCVWRPASVRTRWESLPLSWIWRGMGQGEHRNEKGWESGRARGRGGM